MTEIRPDLEKLLSETQPRALESQLFNIAHSYARAGEMAIGAIGQLRDADFAAPAIMCKSFAIELLLKFFIVAKHPHVRQHAELKALSVDLRGHTYSKLYDRIDARLQQPIAESFAALSGQPASASRFRDTLIEIGDDAFVHWRYVYEKESVQHLDARLMDMVLQALGKTAEVERKKNAANVAAG